MALKRSAVTSENRAAIVASRLLTFGLVLPVLPVHIIDF